MNQEFESFKLNPAGRVLVERTKISFDNLLNDVIKMCPVGRHLSVVKTKLEEACFFAVKAISSDPRNQDVATLAPADWMKSDQ